MKVEICCFSE